MSRQVVFLLFVPIVLLACRPSPTATAVATSIPTQVEQLTQAPTIEPLIQRSPRPSTPIPNPTSTTTPPTPSATPLIATADEDGKVYLGDVLLFDMEQEAGGCFNVNIDYSPTGEFFIVDLWCFEGDNEAFLFKSDGSGKRPITGEWDYINYSNYAWSPDGKYLVYERINSCCADVPATAPPQGIVRYEVQSGDKLVLIRNVHLTPLLWSPDGRWIAFIGSEFERENRRITVLYLIQSDGSGLWRLDRLDSIDDCRELYWDQAAPNSPMQLTCSSDDGMRSTTFFISASPDDLPPGTPIPLASGMPVILYRVVNVQSDDVLNVRSGPGVGNPIVGEIPADGTGIQITGTAVRAGNSLWVPITYGQVAGWVNSYYLAAQSE